GGVSIVFDLKVTKGRSVAQIQVIKVKGPSEWRRALPCQIYVNGRLALLATLITSVPVNNAEIEQQSRGDVTDFIYENLLSNLFTGFVQTTMSSLSSFINNIIQTNPLGLGKRSTDEQLRIDIGTFLYDNVLANLFSGLVNNAFGSIAGVLNNLITTNPLGVGKRAISIWDFLYDNIAAPLFTGLVSNTADLLQNTLVNLITSNPLGVGRRSLNSAQQIVEQSIAKLVAQFKLFADEALSALANNDKQKVQALVKSMINYVKVNVAQLSQQLGNELMGAIPSDVVEKIDQVLEVLRTVFIMFSSSLGSLGPVIGPFPQ
ncbi:unnamed protein product, partial [Didymodactylos carnosus]